MTLPRALPTPMMPPIARRHSSWAARGFWVTLLLSLSAGAQGASAIAATSATPAAAVSTNSLTAPVDSGASAFQPLVPEGEPESLLGVHWDDGIPKFAQRPNAETEPLSVAWSPDGHRVAAGFRWGISVLDVLAGSEQHRFTQYGGGNINSIAWSPDGRLLAIAAGHGTVLIGDVATGRVQQILEQADCDSTTHFAWSPDSKYLAVGYYSGAVRLWDPSSKKESQRFATDGATTPYGLAPRVSSIAWSPDGNFLAFTRSERQLLVWRVRTGRERWHFTAEHGSLDSIAWSPDATAIAAKDRYDAVSIWDANSGHRLRRLEVKPPSPGPIAWSANSKTLSVVSQDLSLQAWHAASGAPLQRLAGHALYFSRIVWSPDQSALACIGDHSIWFWSVGSTGTAPSAVHWADANGWVTWRAGLDPAHRVLRGENGKLLARRGAGKTLEPTAPLIGLHPKLTATARVATSAGRGEPGAIDVSVANAKEATEAIWLEVREPRPFMRDLPGNVSFGFPPTTTRLGPGETVILRVEYRHSVTQDPVPERIKAALAVRHAHDGGREIVLPLSLPFRSARIVIQASAPERRGNELAIPFTISNVGDQTTGRSLKVSSKFRFAAGGSADCESKYFDRLVPGQTEHVALKVPAAAEPASKFKVEFTATEDLAPGNWRGSASAADDEKQSVESIIRREEATYRQECFLSLIGSSRFGYDAEPYRGPVATWTSTSDWMRPRSWYLEYIAAAAGVALLLGVTRWFGVRRTQGLFVNAYTRFRARRR